MNDKGSAEQAITENYACMHSCPLSFIHKKISEVTHRNKSRFLVLAVAQMVTDIISASMHIAGEFLHYSGFDFQLVTLLHRPDASVP